MIEVTLLSSAALDLRRAAEFYSRERAALSAEFLLEFENAGRMIAEHPEIGSVIREDVRKLILKRFPYLIVYRIEPERVLILAVAHQRRHPAAWLNRL